MPRRPRIYASDREKAVMQIQDQDRAVTMVRSAMLLELRKLEREVLAAYRRGRDIESVIRARMDGMAELMTQMSVYTSLLALRTGARQAEPVVKDEVADIAMQSSDVLERGIRFLVNRMLLPTNVMPALEAFYAPEVYRVIRRATDDINAKMNQTIVDVVQGGLLQRDAMTAIRKGLAAAGASPRSPAQIETIFRTQSQLAYGAGARAVERHPAIQRALWGYKYVTAGDTRVRPTHAAMDGVTLPKEDGWWRANTPPNGFNCRCQAIPLYSERSVIEPPRTTKNESGKTVPVEADRGFRFNVANLPIPL